MSRSDGALSGPRSRSPVSSVSSSTGCGSMRATSGSGNPPTPELTTTPLQPLAESPTGRLGRDDGSGTSRWTPWRFNAVLEIGCPVPNPTASCDDHSIDHGQKHDPDHQAQPAILDPSPPMTEGVQLRRELAVEVSDF